ncbi:hypothetical protein BJ508DRAFT_335960 [Ascobolus immersus RN42]|uniref:Uncharacterized protein n=1 Tax=Ascobolus immersus RN42 TaxID=1160509 RepID=A0A3N4HE90_ASCIM|nr:hypothetical protein BJ508DRAFT_335960 [Ascobolus immersus RN42]
MPPKAPASKLTRAQLLAIKNIWEEKGLPAKEDTRGIDELVKEVGGNASFKDVKMPIATFANKERPQGGRLSMESQTSSNKSQHGRSATKNRAASLTPKRAPELIGPDGFGVDSQTGRRIRQRPSSGQSQNGLMSTPMATPNSSPRMQPFANRPASNTIHSQQQQPTPLSPTGYHTLTPRQTLRDLSSQSQKESQDLIRLRTENELLNKELRVQKTHVSHLELAIVASESEYEDLLAKKTKLAAEAKKFAADSEELSKDLEQLTGDNQVLGSKLEGAELRLKRQAEKQKELAAVQEAKIEELNKQISEMSEAMSEVEDLRTKIQTLEIDLEAVGQSYRSLQHMKFIADNEIKHQTGQISNQAREIERLKARIEKDRKDEEANAKEWKEALEAAHSLTSKAEKKLKLVNSSLDDTKEKLTEANDKITALEKDGASKDAELGSLKSRLLNSKDASGVMKAKLDAALQEKEEVELKCSELEKAVKKSEETHVGLNVRVAALEAEEKSLKNKVEKLKENEEKLNGELTAAYNDKHMFFDQLGDANLEKTQLELRNQDLEARVALLNSTRYRKRVRALPLGLAPPPNPNRPLPIRTPRMTEQERAVALEDEGARLIFHPKATHEDFNRPADGSRQLRQRPLPRRV